MHCLNCNLDTDNPKFCSRRCATIHNNQQKPKRGVEGKCSVCKYPISRRLTYCKTCKPRRVSEDISLKEAIYLKHHRSSAFALVRSRARQVGKQQGWNRCCLCGYSKHIEVCHKRSIGSFGESTMISMINDPSNLMPLCPNCHWEYDHGLLEYPQQESNLHVSN